MVSSKAERPVESGCFRSRHFVNRSVASGNCVLNEGGVNHRESLSPIMSSPVQLWWDRTAWSNSWPTTPPGESVCDRAILTGDVVGSEGIGSIKADHATERACFQSSCLNHRCGSVRSWIICIRLLTYETIPRHPRIADVRSSQVDGRFPSQRSSSKPELFSHEPTKFHLSLSKSLSLVSSSLWISCPNLSLRSPSFPFLRQSLSFFRQSLSLFPESSNLQGRLSLLACFLCLLIFFPYSKLVAAWGPGGQGHRPLESSGRWDCLLAPRSKIHSVIVRVTAFM